MLISSHYPTPPLYAQHSTSCGLVQFWKYVRSKVERLIVLLSSWSEADKTWPTKEPKKAFSFCMKGHVAKFSDTLGRHQTDSTGRENCFLRMASSTPVRSSAGCRTVSAPPFTQEEARSTARLILAGRTEPGGSTCAPSRASVGSVVGWRERR